VLETDPQMQSGPHSLYDLHVASTSGQQVPLGAFATVVEQPG
jgi:multidrug efflux pump